MKALLVGCLVAALATVAVAETQKFCYSDVVRGCKTGAGNNYIFNQNLV